MDESTVESSIEAVVGLTEKVPLRVLHVDDDSEFLKVAQQCLKMQGAFEVETATSVEEAMEKMRKKTYDVIISDYMMPEKGGLDFLKDLRQKGNAIPFIIFTGKGREEVAIEALNLGADHYINKIGAPETVYGQLAYCTRKAVKRKRAEMEIWQREEKLRAILASSPDAITASNLQGKIVDCNEAAWKLMGFSSKKELIGKSSFEFIAEKDRERALENLKKTLAQGTVRNIEYTLLKKDGEEYIGELSASILKDASGNPIGFVGVVRDITERKKAEEKLSKSETRFRSLVEDTGAGIITVDIEGRFAFVNKAICRMIGYSEKELLDKPFVDFIHPEDKARILQIFLNFMTYPEQRPNFDFGGIHKNGHTVHLHSTPTLFKHGEKIVGSHAILTDITERKKAEEELRSSEERLKILFDFAPDAYYLNDLKGNFVDGNKAAEELTCYNKSELVGKSFLKLRLLSRRHVPKAAKLLAKNAFGKPTGPDEFVLNRKDGTQVPVEIRTYPVKIKGQTLVLGIARDITERKKAEKELKKTLEKLQVLNEKLGVVGRLTRHDVRNKLSAITGNAYLARQKLADDHDALKYLGEIEPALRQIERIFDFARNYEKLGVEELAYVDVEKSLGEAVSVFSDLHGAKVVNGCRGLTVLADSLLRQLFYNLIHNSLRHGEKVSQIKVYYEETGKDKLRLVYEDDGVGTPKAEKEKIFREGYGKGTGYGLYLIRKICEVYGWTIRETGKPGKGAQFTITMPQGNENGKENYRLP